MRKLILICAAAFLLLSCVTAPPKKSEKPADLYVEGVNALKGKHYEDAIAKFSSVRENFPFDPIALVASVKLGDAQFEKKDYILASGTYEDFFKAHPEDENIPYVLYKLGECYDKLSLSIDRDQSYTLKGIDRLTYLKNRYPASVHAKDADGKLRAMNQRLADREMYVGEFYYRTAKYNACIMRLEYVLKKFPDQKGLDKALYYLVLAELEMGNEAKSDQYLAELRTKYPQSTFLIGKQKGKAKREKKTIQTTSKGEAKPEAKAVDSTTTVKAEPRKAPAPSPVYEEPVKRDIVLTPPPATEERKTPKPDEAGKEKVGTTTVARTAEQGKEKEKGKGADGKDKGIGFFQKNKPVDIVSDTMEGFDNEKYVLFKGSVVAKQEDLSIFSDVIEAYMNAESNEIEKAHAKGNVKILKQERTATCNEAIFNNVKREITLKGNVIVYSGQDKLSGDVIVYYLDDDKVVVVGEKDKRARIIVQPKQESK